jgi:signal transduction histidine kinase
MYSLLKKIREYNWIRFLEVGIDETTPHTTSVATRISNRLVIVPALLNLLMFFIYLAQGDGVKLVTCILFFSLTASVYIFNLYKKYALSRIIVTLIYPLAIGLLQIAMGKTLRADGLFLIFTIFPVIFYANIKQRIISILWVFSIYILSAYYIANYPPLIDQELSLFESIITYIASFSAIIWVSNFYLDENKRHNKNLESKNSELKNKNGELYQVNSELERFAYIASHDLKTPIRTIVSYIELIERRIEKKEYDDLAKYITFVKEGGRNIHNLVTELLEFSKLNIEKQINLEIVDVQDLVNTNILQLESFLQKANASIITANLPTIKTNRMLLSLVFQNLIENGIKYNENPSPKIEITNQSNPNSTIFWIKDNGIGIEQSYFDTIFEIFSRLNPQQAEGTGMGLAITKKIVEQQFGGKISLISSLGKGSTFIIELPNRIA